MATVYRSFKNIYIRDLSTTDFDSLQEDWYSTLQEAKCVYNTLATPISWKIGNQSYCFGSTALCSFDKIWKFERSCQMSIHLSEKWFVVVIWFNDIGDDDYRNWSP